MICRCARCAKARGSVEAQIGTHKHSGFRIRVFSNWSVFKYALSSGKLRRKAGTLIDIWYSYAYYSPHATRNRVFTCTHMVN